MKTRYLIVLVIVAFLLFKSQCQRGGGRSFGRRRAGRSSFPFSAFKSSNKNSTCIIKFLIQTFFINNSTLQNQEDLYEHENSQTFIISYSTITILAVGLILTCIFICTKGQFRYRGDKDLQMKRIFDEFERDNECWGNYNESLANQTFQWFISTKWKVQTRVGFHAKIQSWQLKLNKLTKKSDFLYDLQAQGYNDAQGPFNLKGILLLRNRSIHICFAKSITEKTLHIKKGKLGLVIYRAHSDSGKIQGKWNYDGLRYDPRYSGIMKIVPQ